MVGDGVKSPGNWPVSFVPREEWGAAPPNPAIEEQGYLLVDGTVDLVPLIKRVVIHHSAFRQTASPAFVQKWSMERGYDDIGYHYYIGADGTIYEGRSLYYIGAHAGRSEDANVLHDIRLDPDYGSIGIAVAGCFDPTCLVQEKPTEAQKAALLSLILYLRQSFLLVGPDDVMGHKDVHPTACPGSLEEWVKEAVASMKVFETSSSGNGRAIRPFNLVDPVTGTRIDGARINPRETDLRLINGGERRFDDIWREGGETGVMINGGYFDIERWFNGVLGDAGKKYPKGWLVQDGMELALPETNGPYSGLFTIDRQGRWDIKYLRNTEGDITLKRWPDRYHTAIQAGPLVIESGGRDGIPIPKKPETPMERTILAKNRQGAWFLVTTSAIGFYALQSVIRRIIPDIDAAMALDGGPSTAIAIQGLGVLAPPRGSIPIYLHFTEKKK